MKCQFVDLTSYCWLCNDFAEEQHLAPAAPPNHDSGWRQRSGECAQFAHSVLNHDKVTARPCTLTQLWEAFARFPKPLSVVASQAPRLGSASRFATAYSTASNVCISESCAPSGGRRAPVHSGPPLIRRHCRRRRRTAHRGSGCRAVAAAGGVLQVGLTVSSIGLPPCNLEQPLACLCSACCAFLCSHCRRPPANHLRPVVSGTMLKRHGRDLTQDAADGRLDPLIGRQDVIERALQVRGLGPGHGGNPCAMCFCPWVLSKGLPSV